MLYQMLCLCTPNHHPSGYRQGAPAPRHCGSQFGPSWPGDSLTAAPLWLKAPCRAANPVCRMGHPERGRTAQLPRAAAGAPHLMPSRYASPPLKTIAIVIATCDSSPGCPSTTPPFAIARAHARTRARRGRRASSLASTSSATCATSRPVIRPGRPVSCPAEPLPRPSSQLAPLFPSPRRHHLCSPRARAAWFFGLLPPSPAAAPASAAAATADVADSSDASPPAPLPRSPAARPRAAGVVVRRVSSKSLIPVQVP